MMTSAQLRALYSALITMAAVLAGFGVMYGICIGLGVDASPAILAAALSVGLMRRAGPLEARALLGKFLMLPLIALAAGLVGLALLRLPVFGAALFAGGIALSILLRQYGARAAALGRVIALPLMTTLVVPVHIDTERGGWITPLLVISAGVVSLASTSIVAWIADKLGFADDPEPERVRVAQTARPGQLPIATRMALQMLTALALAFAIGLAAFPQHWSWLVLTAFIVCSGAVGRGDAIYKGLLRLAGAIGGAFVAALVANIVFPTPAAYAAAVFFVLFLGIWLRQINYAYWAACATLIFALLQGSQNADIVPLLAMRVLGIVIGALCGVAATWFVYPIRTEQLVRKRVAETLAALREGLAHAPGSPAHETHLAELGRHDRELQRIAPPVNLHRRVFGAANPEQHPATWIGLMRGLLAEARRADFDRAHLGAEMRRLGGMLKAGSAAPARDKDPG
jgi:hypothetical protein